MTDETRRQELARVYEGVPSAQAFIAVCDRLIAAERERDEARGELHRSKDKTRLACPSCKKKSHRVCELWSDKTELRLKCTHCGEWGYLPAWWPSHFARTQATPVGEPSQEPNDA